jgi:hypothetical protein
VVAKAGVGQQGWQAARHLQQLVVLGLAARRVSVPHALRALVNADGRALHDQLVVVRHLQHLGEAVAAPRAHPHQHLLQCLPLVVE